MPPIRHDPERVIDLDLVRCTENAALAAWVFGSDKNQADGRLRRRVCSADRFKMVRIGEGSGQLPGIFVDEKVGSALARSRPPSPSTRSTADAHRQGPAGATVLAVVWHAQRRSATFSSIPSLHGKFRLPGGGRAMGAIEAPLEASGIVAASNESATWSSAWIGRHERSSTRCGAWAGAADQRRRRGGRHRPSCRFGVDAYVGIGGPAGSRPLHQVPSPNNCAAWPWMCDDNALRENCTGRPAQVWTVEMMAPASISFCATGISDSPCCRASPTAQHCVTHSILMQARNRAVRRIRHITFCPENSRSIPQASCGWDLAAATHRDGCSTYRRSPLCCGENGRYLSPPFSSSALAKRAAPPGDRPPSSTSAGRSGMQARAERPGPSTRCHRPAGQNVTRHGQPMAKA
jgi:hypothetical protein